MDYNNVSSELFRVLQRSQEKRCYLEPLKLRGRSQLFEEPLQQKIFELSFKQNQEEKEQPV